MIWLKRILWLHFSFVLIMDACIFPTFGSFVFCGMLYLSWEILLCLWSKYWVRVFRYSYYPSPLFHRPLWQKGIKQIGIESLETDLHSRLVWLGMRGWTVYPVLFINMNFCIFVWCFGLLVGPCFSLNFLWYIVLWMCIHL